MKKYNVKYEFDFTVDNVYLASCRMLISSIKHIDKNQDISLNYLKGFKMQTAKGDFIVTECSKENGISYEINDGLKADVSSINFEQIDESRTLVFYSEFGISNSKFTQFMFWLKMTFDKKSFDIKAKSIIGSIKYFLNDGKMVKYEN